jgi:enterochelin esterase family protein
MLAEIAAANASEWPRLLDALGTPLTIGPLTTFVHAGEAEAVQVRHFMARFPWLPPMQRVAPGLHQLTVRLPTGARVEYKLAVSHEGNTAEKLDAHNPHRATDPFGENSVAFAPGYLEPWWAAPPEGPRGAVRRGFVESKTFGARRSLHWYRPAGAIAGLPLLVVHDGRDFLQHAAIAEVLDNLIAAGIIPPLVAALIDPGERLVEYTGDARHGEYVLEVAAAAVRRHRVDPDPQNHVYLGASMGAVAALAAAWRTGSVGGLALMSGSFVTKLGGPMHRGDLFLPVIEFMKAFAADPGHPAARIYQACGTYEGLAPDNRAFTPILEATGADVLVEEVRDGHHWHNWRDRLAAALTYVLPSAAPGRPGTVSP